MDKQNRMEYLGEQSRKAVLLRWLVGIGICGGAIGCKFWYPQGAQALQQVVFGRDGRSIEAAFAAFEDSYAENERFGEAVTAFYENLPET